jgi:hypothetical protein
VTMRAFVVVLFDKNEKAIYENMIQASSKMGALGEALRRLSSGTQEICEDFKIFEMRG